MADPTALALSDEQSEAFDSLSAVLAAAGIDLASGALAAPGEAGQTSFAVLGKAGSGKTLLLAQLYAKLTGIGVEIISGDYESRRRRERREHPVVRGRANDRRTRLPQYPHDHARHE